MRGALWAMALLLLALPVRADVYTCEEPGGALRFTSDPAECQGAWHHMEGALEHAAPGASKPSSPSHASAHAPPADAAPAAHSSVDLASLFAPADPGRWTILDEKLEKPITDPQLRAYGLRASQARHYTHAEGAVSEVCTIELWAFEQPAQADAVLHGFHRPGWSVLPAGDLLVLAHGTHLERGVGMRPGLVKGCSELAEATRAKAERR